MTSKISEDKKEAKKVEHGKVITSPLKKGKEKPVLVPIEEAKIVVERNDFSLTISVSFMEDGKDIHFQRAYYLHTHGKKILEKLFPSIESGVDDTGYINSFNNELYEGKSYKAFKHDKHIFVMDELSSVNFNKDISTDLDYLIWSTDTDKGGELYKGATFLINSAIEGVSLSGVNLLIDIDLKSSTISNSFLMGSEVKGDESHYFFNLKERGTGKKYSFNQVNASDSTIICEGINNLRSGDCKILLSDINVSSFINTNSTTVYSCSIKAESVQLTDSSIDKVRILSTGSVDISNYSRTNNERFSCLIGVPFPNISAEHRLDFDEIVIPNDPNKRYGDYVIAGGAADTIHIIERNKSSLLTIRDSDPYKEKIQGFVEAATSNDKTLYSCNVPTSKNSIASSMRSEAVSVICSRIRLIRLIRESSKIKKDTKYA